MILLLIGCGVNETKLCRTYREGYDKAVDIIKYDLDSSTYGSNSYYDYGDTGDDDIVFGTGGISILAAEQSTLENLVMCDCPEDIDWSTMNRLEAYELGVRDYCGKRNELGFSLDCDALFQYVDTHFTFSDNYNEDLGYSSSVTKSELRYEATIFAQSEFWGGDAPECSMPVDTGDYNYEASEGAFEFVFDFLDDPTTIKDHRIVALNDESSDLHLLFSNDSDSILFISLGSGSYDGNRAVSHELSNIESVAHPIKKADISLPNYEENLCIQDANNNLHCWSSDSSSYNNFPDSSESSSLRYSNYGTVDDFAFHEFYSSGSTYGLCTSSSNSSGSSCLQPKCELLPILSPS
jgi:hypothetical protein